MADGDQTNTVPLKVMVEKNTNRVAFAEANAVFADTLFSFLTLPLGRISKILPPEKFTFELGCINNLYQSVESLDSDMFPTDACKTMLLHPQNAAHGQCCGLKVKVDPDWNEPKKIYVCPNSDCILREYRWASSYENGTCVCGGEMTIAEVLPDQLCSTDVQPPAVFVNETAAFLISDELQVNPLNSSAILSILKSEGLAGLSNDLEERVVNLKVTELLCSLLLPERPLSYLIFQKAQLLGGTLLLQPKEERYGTAVKKEGMFLVNVFYSKSDKKVLYAEAGADFVGMLFSFLTIPIGAIAKLLGGNSPLPALNAVYNSIKNPSTRKHFKSWESKSLVLNPKLAPYFQSDPKAFDLVEYNMSDMFTYGEQKIQLKFCNPKSLTISDNTGGGYLRGTKTFMIKDDLVVKPFSSSSAVSLLRGVPITDVHEREVSVSKREALNLLKSSLKSKSVLTDVFGPLIQSI